MNSDNRVIACVDLDAAAYNIANIRKRVKKDAKVMAIIKADAYGHGAIMYGKTMLEHGADRLGVALLDEGIELRKAGIDAPILLLGYTPSRKFEYVVKNNLIQTIFNREQGEELNEVAERLGKKAIVHIKVETGMSRLGFIPNEESARDVSYISTLKNIELEGAFTHLAIADIVDKTYTLEQVGKFKDFMSALEKKGVTIPIKHVSNSAATMDLDELNFDMVRPGIMLYGLMPSDEVSTENIKIKPVMTLKSCLSHVKTLEKGITIGYGRTYTLERNTLVGTIPVGYADGISRSLSNKGRVLVNGQYANIIGRVCMDQIMVDLTDIKDVKQGEEVVLFGKQGDNEIPVDEIAGLRGTINYEVVCNVARRIPRQYIKDGKIVEEVNYLLD